MGSFFIRPQTIHSSIYALIMRAMHVHRKTIWSNSLGHSSRRYTSIFHFYSGWMCAICVCARVVTIWAWHPQYTHIQYAYTVDTNNAVEIIYRFENIIRRYWSRVERMDDGGRGLADGQNEWDSTYWMKSRQQLCSFSRECLLIWSLAGNGGYAWEEEQWGGGRVIHIDGGTIIRRVAIENKTLTYLICVLLVFIFVLLAAISFTVEIMFTIRVY